jgi:hypothetical protein
MATTTKVPTMVPPMIAAGLRRMRRKASVQRPTERSSRRTAMASLIWVMEGRRS